MLKSVPDVRKQEIVLHFRQVHEKETLHWELGFTPPCLFHSNEHLNRGMIKKEKEKKTRKKAPRLMRTWCWLDRYTQHGTTALWKVRKWKSLPTGSQPCRFPLAQPYPLTVRLGNDAPPKELSRVFYGYVYPGKGNTGAQARATKSWAINISSTGVNAQRNLV